MTTPTSAAELIGPAGVRNDIVAFLRVWYPQHVLACRAAWGLTKAQLPVPVSKPTEPREDAYLPREPAALDRWPMIAVTTGRRTTARGRGDISDDGDPIYESTYPVRVWSWVRTEGANATQDMRDYMASALMVTLVSHVNLGTNGRLRLTPTTMVTDFSAVEKVNGERFVAGSYVGFDVSATETLTDRLAHPQQQPRDTVSDVTVTATVLPHQFLT